MNNLIKLFDNLDKTDLKIIKIGIKICFGILLIGCIFLVMYLVLHNLLLYELGLAIIKLSTYIAVEFIVCGFIVDLIKNGK